MKTKIIIVAEATLRLRAAAKEGNVLKVKETLLVGADLNARAAADNLRSNPLLFGNGTPLEPDMLFGHHEVGLPEQEIFRKTPSNYAAKAALWVTEP